MTNLYNIYDLKSDSIIGNIFSAKTNAVAIRAFSDALQDKNSTIGQHPQDFVLIQVGEQHDTGAIAPILGGSGTIEIITGAQIAALGNNPA